MYTIDIKGDINSDTVSLVDKAISQDDNEVMMNISSDGGSLSDGFLCYTKIRQAKEKTFYANVIDYCMSSASLFLMAVPIERRSANRYSTILIHNPLTNVGYASLNDVKAIASSMEDAKSKLVDIYAERTSMDKDEISLLMDKEREMYADEALNRGIIGKVNKLYNYKEKDNNGYMKKSYLRNFINHTLKGLLNQIYTLKDGNEIDIDELVVGGKTTADDGVYVLNDDTTITVADGAVIDIIPPVSQQEEQPQTEETPVNEVKNEETQTEETQTEEPKADETKKVEETAQVVEEIAKDAEKAESVEDLQTIAEEIKKAVDEQISELQSKYDALKGLVDKCGGEARLNALLNIKKEKEFFNAEPQHTERKSYSIAELAKMGKK